MTLQDDRRAPVPRTDAVAAVVAALGVRHITALGYLHLVTLALVTIGRIRVMGTLQRVACDRLGFPQLHGCPARAAGPASHVVVAGFVRDDLALLFEQPPQQPESRQFADRLVIREGAYQRVHVPRDHWQPWIGVMTLWTVPDPTWTSDREEYWWAITNADGSVRPAYADLLKARGNGGALSGAIAVDR